MESSVKKCKLGLLPWQHELNLVITECKWVSLKSSCKKNMCKKTVNNTFNDVHNIMITTIFFFAAQLSLVISLFLSFRLNVKIYFLN